jgi:uncharacterized protein (TIGR03437 family)
VARISADQLTIYFDLFDFRHNFISENSVVSPASPPGDIFQSISLADLDGDGKLDLIAAFANVSTPGPADRGVWSFAGNGDGTFQTGKRQVLISGVQPTRQTISIGDLNGDHIPDIVLAAPGLDLDVFLGNGDGSFQTKALPVGSSSTCADPASAAIADLNGDGKSDLVLGSCDNQATVAIALGNGDGTFQTPTVYPALYPGYPVGSAAMVAVGDLNGDGTPDIVTAGGTILFGDGKGGVASRADYEPNLAGASLGDFLSTGAGPILIGTSVMLGDFDGDGKTDILFGLGNAGYLSGNANSPALSVLFGSGSGVFTGAPVSAVPIPSSAFTYSGPLPPPVGALIAADYNGDGNPDIASVTFSQTSDNGGNVQLTVLRGLRDGQFSSGTTQTFPHAGAFLLRAAVSGDFNHDGKLDLAVALSDYPTGGEIQIYPGKGDGTFGAPLITPLTIDNPLSIAAADLNGDGVPDVLLVGDSAAAVLMGKGDGTFSAPATIPGVGNAAILGDFNGDGKPDIAITGETSLSVSILLGKGDGTFSNAILTPLPSAAVGYPGQIVSADFNTDGKLDLAVSLGSRAAAPGVQNVAILLGKGDGTFGAPYLTQTGTEALAVADCNGDKIPDLIGIVRPSVAPPTPSGALSVRLGNGDGTFQPDGVVLGSASIFVAADLNHDGLTDIAAFYGGGILSLLNNSQPAAPLTVVSAASFAPGPLAPGSIASAFGAGILPAGQTAAGTSPLPATLAGVSVTVRDSAGVSRPAALYFVSSNQINFVIPAQTSIGVATVTVAGALSSQSLNAQAQIAAVAPSFFTIGSETAAAYAVQVAPNGAQTVLPVFTTAPVPIDLSSPDAVYVALFGAGFDSANASSTIVTVQGVSVPVTYAGPQGTYSGMDQINILLPPSLAGTGLANISASVAGIVSNTVQITIK